jgi:hypothetical protein
MRRREFIAGLGGGCGGVDATGAGAQPALPVMSYLYSGTAVRSGSPMFLKGLNEMGYVERRNVAIEHRGSCSRTAATSKPCCRRRSALKVSSGIMAPIGNHSFRATTTYLANGDTLEHA